MPGSSLFASTPRAQAAKTKTSQPIVQHAPADNVVDGPSLSESSAPVEIDPSEVSLSSKPATSTGVVPETVQHSGDANVSQATPTVAPRPLSAASVWQTAAPEHAPSPLPSTSAAFMFQSTRGQRGMPNRVVTKAAAMPPLTGTWYSTKRRVSLINGP